MVRSLSWQLSVTSRSQLGAGWLRNAGLGTLPPKLLHHLQQGRALHLQGQRSLLQFTLAGKKLLHCGFKALDPSICHLENGRRDENGPASDYTRGGCCECHHLVFRTQTSLLMISSGHRRKTPASSSGQLDPNILQHLLPWCSPSGDQGLRKRHQNTEGTGPAISTLGEG